MRTVTVQLRADDEIGTTDRRLFGAFIEHLGRCVYGGIFEPGHSTADSHGFRRDVLALVRELAPTIVRYPRSAQRFLSMHAAVHNTSTSNATSFRDRPCGSSEPRRRRNGQTPSQQRET